MVILRTEPFKYILTMYLPDGLSTGTPLRCGKMLREMSVRPKRRSHAAHTASDETKEQSATSVCVMLSNVKCWMSVGLLEI